MSTLSAIIAALCLMVAAVPAHAETPAPLRGLSDPTLALGVGPIRDWDVAQPFLDRGRTMRPWIGIAANGDRLSHLDLRSLRIFDDAGWATTLPDGVDRIRTTWAWKAGAPGADGVAGDYVLTYKGAGDLHLLLDADVTRALPGRIEFTNQSGGPIIVEVTATDPAGTGDYIRDITLVRKADEALLTAGAMFDPDWLALVQDARQIRFMDWIETNNSAQKTWSDRARLTDATWSGPSGAPIEAMVRLANEIGADPWFTIPHLADDDYVRRFALYVRDHLDPRLVATVEYSNELWNHRFAQARMVGAEAGSGLFGQRPAVVAAARAYHVVNIWKDVFGDQADDRLVRVFAAHTASPGWARKAMSAKAPDAGLLSSRRMSDGFDALAVTTYFGNGPALLDKIFNAWSRKGDGAAADIARLLRDPSLKGALPAVAANLAAHKAIAQDAGLRLIAYEGGQHLHSLAVERRGGPDFSAFIAGYVNSPAMGRLYQDMWAIWRKVGDGPFMHFTATGMATKFGTWGLYQHYGDHNPRADTLARLNRETMNWWGAAGGDRYRQNGYSRADAGKDDI